LGFDGKDSHVDEIAELLDQRPQLDSASMSRALVPALHSLQISEKLGLNLLARTAALSWSVEHMICNFDLGK
jgi:hypothetical protein